MSYCVIPGCVQPQNPESAKTCQSCGSKLILKARYRPIQALGQGGFGRTFLAVDEDIPSKPKCVVKQLFFQQGETQHIQKVKDLFYHEAVRLDDLGHHPQIPSLLAHFEQNQGLYLVQEFIEGPTLSSELKQKGAYQEAEIRELLNDLLPVLTFIHDRQIVHRDIKPPNIIRRIRSDRPSFTEHQGGQIVLIDFGIAKLLSATAMMQTGTIIGSPEYMAPEQTRGKVVPATDLYSLGVTCLHLFTGMSPGNLYDANEDCWIWRDFVRADKLVSADLGQILDKLVENALTKRYHSAVEVLQDLNSSPAASLARSPSPTPPLRRSTIQPKATPVTPKTTSWRDVLNQFFTGIVPSPIPVREPNILISTVGIDYGHLRDLLTAKKWKQADEETRTLLCQAAGKYPRGYLFEDDIAKMPCEDLQMIDLLWVNYSDARFGFSIQSRIYEGVGKDYGALCDRIGWKTYNPSVPYEGIQFNLKAPIGHLPSRSWSAGSKWWRHAGAIAAKLEQCDLQTGDCRQIPPKQGTI
ncbi:GUN4 domain-containing protein [Phormidium pseudopriestleyi FRX01]|uniref:non-specific serine/threonine protein kinase n=1 Tax=Phormidium pseudopriestleyi FRX01 TaxID=1759528 RepID=A0ABS3FNR8_9CYAN|nr:serine/threonine-protein kinase [Phormidium pseudopriestleyi]MBO0348765.1 GUN4 domain-containing protein [Phormidium pseudopriestleyi FRX01]